MFIKRSFLEFLMFVLPLLAFLGQYFGLLLAKFIPEEREAGYWYFLTLQFVFFFCLLFTFPFDGAWILFFAGLICGLVFSFPYFWFSLGLFLPGTSFLSFVFVFLYGFPYGTLFYSQKDRLPLFLNVVWFFLAGLLSFVIAPSFVFGGVLGAFIKDIKQQVLSCCYVKHHRLWFRRRA